MKKYHQRISRELKPNNAFTVKHKKRASKPSSRLKKSLVWLCVSTQVSTPVLLSLSPVVQANVIENNTNIKYDPLNEKMVKQSVSDNLIIKGQTYAENYFSQFGSSEIKINAGDDFSLASGELNVLFALDDKTDSLVFGQFGTRFDDATDRTTVNIGFGQRHFIDNQMFGYNAFFDHELNNAHSRIGIGSEYGVDYFKATANGYFGITDWSTSDDPFLAEKAASGYDIRLEGYLPNASQFGSKLTLEQYFGDSIDLLNNKQYQKDPLALTFGLNYTPVPLITFGVDHKMTTNNRSDTQFNIGLNFSFGRSIESQLKSDQVQKRRQLNGSRYDIVSRNNEIVLAKKAINLLKVSLPGMINASEGSTIPFDVQVSGANGQITYQWDAADFLAAGGEIVELGNQWHLTLPLFTDSGVNTYHVGMVVVDSKGNKSNYASSLIQVGRKYGDEPSTVSTAFFGEEGLVVTGNPVLANGIDTVTASVSVVTSDGQPYLNQLVAFDITHADGSVTTTLARTDEDGLAFVELTETLAGTMAISVTLAEVTQTKTVNFGADSSSAIFDSAGLTLVGDNLKANGSDKAIAKVVVVDAFNNKLPNMPIEFSILRPDGTTYLALASTNDQGEAILDITETQAGVLTVSATLNGITQAKSVTYQPDQTTAKFDGTGLILEGNNLIANGSNAANAYLKVLDANGNPIDNYTVTFNLQRPDNTTHVVEALTDETGVAKIAITETIAGQIKVSVTLNGETQTRSTTFIADESTAMMGAAGLTLEGTNLIANGLDAAIAMLPITDKNGNALSQYSVTFNIQRPNGDTYQTNVLTDETGLAQLSITETLAGTIAVSVTLGGVQQTQTTAFIADESTAAISGAGLTLSGTNLIANGSDAAIAMLPVADVNGNPIGNFSVTFNLQRPDNTTYAVEALTDEAGVAKVAVTETMTGPVSVSVTLNGETQTRSTTFIADESTAMMGAAGLTLEGTNLIANGLDAAIAMLPITDKNGNPLSQYSVTFNIQRPNGESYQTNVLTDETGLAQLSITETLAGTLAVSVTLGGVQQTQTTAFIADESTAAISGAGLTLSGTNLIANGSDAAIAMLPVADVNGNPIGNFSVTFNLQRPDNTTYAVEALTDEAGVAKVAVTETMTGPVSVSVTLNGETQTRSTTFIADESTAMMGAAGLTLEGTNLIANGLDAAIAMLPITDKNGNPLSQYSVTFNIQRPNGETYQTNVLTDETGLAQLSITETLAGTIAVSVTLGGVQQTQTTAFIADESTAAISGAGLTLSGTNLIANGSDAAIAMLPIADANGNPIANQSIVFTITRPNSEIYQTAIDTNEQGIATLEITETIAGQLSVAINYNGVSQTKSTEFIADSSTAKFGDGELTITGTNLVANGLDTGIATIKVTDNYDNPLTAIGVTFEIIRPDGSTYSEVIQTNQFGEAILGISETQSGLVTVNATLNSVTQTKTTIFLPDATTAMFDTSGLVITGNNLLANGDESAVAMVTIVDANNNLVPNQTVSYQVTRPDGTIYSTPVTTDEFGQAVLDITEVKAGTVSISAEFNGDTRTGTINFIADISTAMFDPSGLVVTGDNLLANGFDKALATVIIVDAQNNPIPNLDIEFQVIHPDSSQSTLVGRTDENGIAKIEVRESVAGNVTIEATVGGVVETGTVNFGVDLFGGQFGDAGLNIVGNNLIANEVDNAVATVEIVNKSGQPFTQYPVVFKVKNPDNTVTEIPAITDINGIAQVNITNNQAGTTIVTVSLVEAEQSKEVTFIADEATARVMSANFVNDGAVADLIAQNTLELVIADVNNNVIGDYEVQFTSDNLVLESASVITDSAGKLLLNMSTSVAGSIALNYTLENNNTGTVYANFVAGEPVVEFSTFTSSPSIIGTTPISFSTLEVTLKDKYQNLVTGRDISFDALLPADDYHYTPIVETSAGVYTSEFRVKRTRSAIRTGQIKPNVSVAVDGQKFGMPDIQLTVNKQAHVIKFENGVGYPLESMTNLYENTEVVRFSLKYGDNLPLVELPNNVPVGTVFELFTESTNPVTVRFNNIVIQVSLALPPNDYLVAIFNGTTWVRQF